MELQPDPPVVRTARNRGERAAQIQRIKERLDGLGGSAHHVAAELVVLAEEIKRIIACEDAPNPCAFPSRKRDCEAINTITITDS